MNMICEERERDLSHRGFHWISNVISSLHFLRLLIFSVFKHGCVGVQPFAVLHWLLRLSPSIICLHTHLENRAVLLPEIIICPPGVNVNCDFFFLLIKYFVELKSTSLVCCMFQKVYRALLWLYLLVNMWRWSSADVEIAGDLCQCENRWIDVAGFGCLCLMGPLSLKPFPK